MQLIFKMRDYIGDVGKWQYIYNIESTWTIVKMNINVDGGYHAATAQGGVRVVVRDEVGFCLAVFARSFPAVFSAFHMELEACS